MNALNILCLQIKWREFIIEVLQAHRYDEEEEGERFGAAKKKLIRSEKFFLCSMNRITALIWKYSQSSSLVKAAMYWEAYQLMYPPKSHNST